MAREKKHTHTDDDQARCCTIPEVQVRSLAHISDGHRQRLIAKLDRMWVNGTQLTYYFFKQPAHWRGG
ncbi:MAG: hypothetical protein HWE19_03235, partial [Vibrionaceae bacterium]|nr:hypothetical protein [Vibrionaceae bacterium]